MTSSTAQDFIANHFSFEFIEKSKRRSVSILNTLYYDFSIAKHNQSQSIPTEEFNLVNLEGKFPSIGTSELINTFLHNREFTENEVLYLTISFLSSTRFQNLIDTIRMYDETQFNEDILSVLIAKHITKQLPHYLFDYLHSSIIRFCGEFDISNGHIENIYFKSIQDYYSLLLIE
ncbi:hypothetical protein LNQ81_15225 [Myroides sp. M-43]|uniref:hypothetical protein n=1 Tax=Myroides oncorhynchi TaxID=2893756 RepID=UPI001E36BF3F|nr:hypothetical protein [Myroides oncorhynchi]MCC9044027.1 hypothetical protein [Myroides oncorhynchi]